MHDRLQQYRTGETDKNQETWNERYTVFDGCSAELQSRLQSQSSSVSAASRVRLVRGSSTLYRLATAYWTLTLGFPRKPGFRESIHAVTVTTDPVDLVDRRLHCYGPLAEFLGRTLAARLLQWRQCSHVAEAVHPLANWRHFSLDCNRMSFEHADISRFQSYQPRKHYIFGSNIFIIKSYNKYREEKCKKT